MELKHCAQCELTYDYNGFTMIEPGGVVRQFCDDDCLRTYYQARWDRFLEAQRQENML